MANEFTFGFTGWMKNLPEHDGTYASACDAILAERSAIKQADKEFLESLGVKCDDECSAG